MTDHGEQPRDPQRAPNVAGEAGRSFADAWNAEPVPSAPEPTFEVAGTLATAYQATFAGAATATADVISPRGATAAAEPSDVTDELERGGPAFGSFVRAVGKAVADAQTRLDETLIETAEALSRAQVNVVAVFEQHLNDDGTMRQGNPIMQKLPLINFLTPTAYHWTRVVFEADMTVREFNARNGFNIQSSSSSFGAGAAGGAVAGLGGVFAGFGAGFAAGVSDAQRAGTTTASTDTAAGKLHMEATLEPRADVELPRPFIIQKGPTLRVTAGNVEAINSTTTPPAQIGRKVTLIAELRKTDNSPSPGQTLSVRASNPLLSTSTAGGSMQTDANGRLALEIRREGNAFDPNRPPEPVVVTVSLNLINEQVAITL